MNYTDKDFVHLKKRFAQLDRELDKAHRRIRGENFLETLGQAALGAVAAVAGIVLAYWLFVPGA